jgi:hypothetical protein
MPLFMDVHRNVEGADPSSVADAHRKDVEEKKHGVRYLKYWHDAGTGTIFCLCEAPTMEAAARVHREAHGLMADEIFEVHEGS